MPGNVSHPPFALYAWFPTILNQQGDEQGWGGHAKTAAAERWRPWWRHSVIYYSNVFYFG